MTEGTEMAFTGVDPDDLEAAAARLQSVHDDLASVSAPLSRHARHFGAVSEVPEIGAALERFAAAASTMTGEVALHVRGAVVMGRHVAADVRAAGGGH